MTRLSRHSFFFFNDTPTTEIYTLSLHDALPISLRVAQPSSYGAHYTFARAQRLVTFPRDRKSTRLNSSHVEISYAVFCLKKKKKERRKIAMIEKQVDDLHPQENQVEHRREHDAE